MTAALSAWMLLCGSAAWADTVELKSGEKLEGVILEQDDQTLVLQHDVLGRIEIPMTEVKPPEEEEVTPGLFGTSILRGWNKAVSAGVSGSSGKSKEITVNADLHLSRELERHRTQFVARFNRARSEGSTSENALDTRFVHDFLFPPSSWFPFITVAYRLDSQQDWLHRLSGQTGVGYDFIRDEEWEFTGRIGGGVSQTLTDERRKEAGQKVGEDPIRTEPNSMASLQLLWNYYEGQSLSAATLYLLDLKEAPDYRSESRAEWKIAMGFVQGLAFKLGTSFIYDSHEQGSNKRDFRYYGNLVYDF
jgi:hypothetical protein